MSLTTKHPIPTQRGRLLAIVGLVAVVVVILGGRWLFLSEGYRVVKVHVIHGVTTAVNDQQTAVGITENGHRGGAGYLLTAIEQWRGVDGTWHQGSLDGTPPDCVPPLSWGAPVEIGVVDEPSFAGTTGGRALIWMKCLGPPTHGDAHS